ncbi:zinc finger protein 320-like isoform X2 [Saccostrea cucullata]|uniref:zinc finger protein 320-like isoform X2 n=1 Tax=Saccostrea cuccullata TaxID=36930 RepID=UPI002ED58E91
MMEGAEVDLGDYMEVVTTYHCKFCIHTCQTVKDMALHVQQDHLSSATSAAKDPPQSTQNSDTGTPDALSDGTVANVMVISQDAQLEPQEKAPTTQILNEIKAENIETGLDITETDQQNTEILNNNENPAEEEDFVNETSNKLTFDIDGKIVELSLENGNIENMAQSVVMKNNVEGLEVLDSTENFIAVETGTSTTGTEPITKELFLCGQCNTGFTSMEQCQDHMYKEHNVTVEDGKVSVGTQVETRSRRKNQKRAKNESEEVKATDLNDSDVEWTIESETQYISKGSRTRSKICPPKALKNDYYLGKTRSSDSNKTEHKPRQPKSALSYQNKCGKPGCNARFLTKAALEIHLKCHTDKPEVFMCPECQQEQNRWRLVRLHLWKAHQIDTDLLKCDQCDYKIDTASRLKVHQEIHSKEKPYTCDTCGKHFRQQAQMRNHQMVHSDNKNSDKWYGEQECEICSRKFVSKKCLQVHLQVVHGNHKPFSCTVCEYTTARKAQLELHMRTHTQEKPFKCDVCNYASIDHNSLRRHKMRHSGQKPYKCPHCPYSCIQAICFKTHMKNKHFGAHGIFCCEFCTYKSVNEQKYLDHVRDHKNGLIPTTSVKKKPENITFAPRIQNISQSVPHIEIVNAGEQAPVFVGGNVENPGNQIQMHVEMSESGERSIREEDLQRLMREGLVTQDITQLISCAMNAISQETSIQGGESHMSPVPNSGQVTTHMITFHLPPPPSNSNTVQLQDQNIVTVDPLTSKKDEKKESTAPAVYFTENQGVLLNTSDIQLQQEGDPGSVLLNIQSSGVPANLIQIAANEAEVTQSATIQDLAQISCLVKDSVYTTTTYSNIEG